MQLLLKKVAQLEEPASLKMFLHYAKISCDEEKHKLKLHKEI